MYGRSAHLSTDVSVRAKCLQVQEIQKRNLKQSRRDHRTRMTQNSTSEMSTTLPSCTIVPAGERPRPLADEIVALHTAAYPHLCEQVPATQGHRIALWQTPALDTLVLHHWLRTLGVIPVYLNARWTVEEVAGVLSRTPCIAMILPFPPTPVNAPANALLPKLHALLPPSLRFILLVSRASHTSPRYIAAQFGGTASDCASDTPPGPHVHDDERPSTVFFTSGTTARPKAVPLTERNLNVQSRAKHDVLGMDTDTRYLNLAPLFHIGGFSSSHATTLIQGTHIFPPPALRITDRADAATLLSLIDAQCVTLLVMVPTMLYALLDAWQDVADVRLAHLRTVLYGGGALSIPTRERLHALLPHVRVIGAYGMTETTSSMTFLDHSALPKDSPLHTSAGQPPAHIELRVDASGRDARGQIQTRGLHVMPGYLGAAEPVNDTQQGDWFSTGDLGSLDKLTGNLYVHGRMHDVIKSGGETVFAPEVEECLRAHNFVKDAVVVGLPHPVLGQAVTAAIELSPASEKLSNALQVLKESCLVLSSFKRPKWILFEEELPRNASGKVLKHKVTQRLQKRIPTNARL